VSPFALFGYALWAFVSDKEETYEIIDPFEDMEKSIPSAIEKEAP